MGIGINTGEVVLGNLGSEKRQSYTAVGGPINIAFRVESETSGGEILITPSVLENVSELVSIGRRREAALKGIPGTITLYSVEGMREPEPVDT